MQWVAFKKIVKQLLKIYYVQFRVLAVQKKTSSILCKEFILRCNAEHKCIDRTIEHQYYYYLRNQHCSRYLVPLASSLVPLAFSDKILKKFKKVDILSCMIYLLNNIHNKTYWFKKCFQMCFDNFCIPVNWNRFFGNIVFISYWTKGMYLPWLR